MAAGWQQRIEGAGAQVIDPSYPRVGRTAGVEMCDRFRIVHHHRLGNALAPDRVGPFAYHDPRYPPQRSNCHREPLLNFGGGCQSAATEQHARSLRLGKLCHRVARSAVQEEEVGSGSCPCRQWGQVIASAAGEPDALSAAPRSGEGIAQWDREFRDAGGPVTAFTLGPRWLMPPMVLATSPGAIRDILSVKDDSVDKTTPVFDEMRNIIGANLADLPFEPWKSRRRTLQPVFTKQRVNEFGGQMAQAAQAMRDGWREDAEIDLDAECRLLTMRALGAAVLGIDLDAGPTRSPSRCGSR